MTASDGHAADGGRGARLRRGRARRSAELCERAARARARAATSRTRRRSSSRSRTLCRDVCHYCTFARPPRRGERAYLTPDEVLAIARAGRGGRLPRGALHARRQARAALPRRARGARRARLRDDRSPTSRTCAGAVLRETGLLPHANPGVLDDDELLALREVSRVAGDHARDASARACRSAAGRTSARPTSCPRVRLDAIDARRAAARSRSPRGILIGIGETRARARRGAARAARPARAPRAPAGGDRPELPRQARHQDGATRPSPRSRITSGRSPSRASLLPPDVRLQAPPNLAPTTSPRLLEAGIDDWGGVSPVTPDHVNPEAPWPDARRASRAADGRGRAARCAPRLADLPALPARRRALARPGRARAVRARGLATADGARARRGHLVRGHDAREPPPAWQGGRRPRLAGAVSPRRSCARSTRSERGSELGEDDAVTLLGARGPEVELLAARADARARRARRATRSPTSSAGTSTTPTSATSAAGSARSRRAGSPRTCAARPTCSASTRSCAAAPRPGIAAPPRSACRAASTPASRAPGTSTLVRAIRDGAARPARARVLAARGLAGRRDRRAGRCATTSSSCATPGSAACRAPRRRSSTTRCARSSAPTSLRTEQWLEVMRTAHAVGLRIDVDDHVRAHRAARATRPATCSRIRDLQRETGGFTEFVPLPFVHEEAPIALKGLARARARPSARPSSLHAAARLVLDPHVTNIQASWVKLGPDGARALLDAGVNDLGGTLMNESISRAAGASHGQECPPERMEEVIRAAGREPRQRTTLYGDGAGRARRRVVRRRAARTGRSAALRRRWAAAPRPPDPARPDQRVGNLPGSAESSWTGARKGYC